MIFSLILKREREISISCLPHVLQAGTKPAIIWCLGHCSNQLNHLIRVGRKYFPSSILRHQGLRVVRPFRALHLADINQMHPVHLPDPLSPSGHVSRTLWGGPYSEWCALPLTGVGGVQRFDYRLHPGGVAAVEACTEGPVQGRDDGDLLEPGLAR